MAIDHLLSFLRVYRLGSQREAAESLNITQPAISQHIQKLEGQLGRPLFVRHGRKLASTPTAHLLALKIGKHLDSLENIVNQLSLGQIGDSQPVHVAGSAALFAKVFVPQLKLLLEHDLQIHFLSELISPLEALLNESIDLAIVSAPVTHPHLMSEPLMEETYILVGRPEYLDRFPEGIKGNKLRKAVADLPWIILEGTLPLVNEYYQGIFEKPFEGTVALSVDNLWALEDAVLAGLGVSVLPSYFCFEALMTGKIVPIIASEYPVLHQFYLAWRQGALNRQPIALTREMLLQAVARFYERLEGK